VECPDLLDIIGEIGQRDIGMNPVIECKRISTTLKQRGQDSLEFLVDPDRVGLTLVFIIP